jgi:hypothetical protein
MSNLLNKIYALFFRNKKVPTCLGDSTLTLTDGGSYEEREDD